MTKYIKLTAAPEVQAKPISSQAPAPPSQNNDHPSGKSVIIINPKSEHKLGLVNKQFTKLGPCNVSCVYRRTGTVVKFDSESELESYKTLLAAHKVEYRDDKRTTKYVLKGLSPAFNPKDIQSELVESGFEVIEVTNMVSWVTKRPLPIFKLILESGAQSRRIEELKQVGLHHIKIEPFLRHRKPPKCSNCQKPNHTAGRCKAPPRCRNCSLEHKTADCMTQSQNQISKITKISKPPTKTNSTQTPQPKQINKPKTNTTSTQTPPPKETPKPKNRQKTTSTQTTPTKENFLKQKTHNKETQTRPPKIKQEQKNFATIETQTDPPVICIPEIFDIPLISPLTDSDTDPEPIRKQKTRRKKKSKDEATGPTISTAKRDYMKEFAQMAAEIHRNHN